MHLWDDEAGYSTFKHKNYAFVEDDKGQFLSLTGKKLKKTGKWSHEAVEDGEVFEPDINPEMRVLIDHYLDSDEVSTNHREMIIDIEVSTDGGLPDIEATENEIIAISIYSRITDSYTTFILDKENVLQNYTKGNTTVIAVSDEQELLSKFHLKYSDINPTILTGWNIDFFDIPYLYNRTKKLLGSKVANLLSPIGVVTYLKYRNRYRIAGVSCLDYLAIYKNFTYSQESSYTLDAIATKEVGIGKVKYEGSLDTLFKTDIEKFIEYNINDVHLVKLIDDKHKFLELARTICHKGHVPYEDIFYSSKFLEGAILVYMRKMNLAAPPRPKTTDEFGKINFTGAYVKAPQAGRYFWIYDLDMTALYPSVIMSLNISPETKGGKVEGWDPGDYLKNVDKTHTLVVGNKHTTIHNKDLKMILDKGKFSIASNGVFYSTNKKGIIPAILELWFDERVEYRNLMKKYGDGGNKKMYEYFKNRQHTQKILLNSMYGVLGLPSFRFYDKDNAAAVTTTGVSLIQYAEKMTNYYYNKELNNTIDYCVYIDTDSIFYPALPLVESRYPGIDIKNEGVMTEKILEIVEDVQKFLNSSFDYFAKKFLNIPIHKFSIKQELIAKSGIWLAAKKRYALLVVNDNGVKVDKMEVKGIDVVRSDFPMAFRSFMSQILKDILSDEKKENIDSHILTFKKNVCILSLDKIAKPTSVKGVTKYTVKKTRIGDTTIKSFGFKNYEKGAPAHVKASIMYNNLIDYYGINKKFRKIQDNEKIKWVYLKQNEFGIEALAHRGHDDPKEIIDFINKYIDHVKMFESVFADKIEDFYKTMKWALPSESQETMNNFFTF